MSKIKEYYVTIIVIAIVIVINIVAFGLYISNINKDIEKQTEEHLTEIMEEASTSIELKIEESIQKLNMTAFYIGLLQDYTEEEEFSNIVKMTKKAGFQKFDIIDKSGIGLASNGSIDYSENKVFTKAIGDNIVIKDIAGEDGSINEIEFCVPVKNETQEVIGAYLVKCNLDEFTTFLDLDSVSKKGKAFIVKRDGTILSRKEGSTIQTLDDILKDNSSGVKTLKSHMKSKNSGVLGFENGDSKRYICYSKTDYNNWEIIMVVSSNEVEANVSDVTDNFVFLGVIIGIMLILLIGYFIYTLIHAKSKNAMNLRRYYMVSKYTENIILDYSCAKDTLYCNENWKKMFGYELPKEQVKDNINSYLFEEDKAHFYECIEKLKDSDDVVSFTCRILDKDQNIIECICKLFGVKESKNLIKIVGVIDKRL